MTSETKDLTTLTEALDAARVAYEEAELAESQARSRRTAALNRMNDAQKAFDKAVGAIRAKGPRDSDWGRSRSKATVV